MFCLRPNVLRKIIRHSKKLAELELPQGNHRHFAYIVKRNKVVAFGYNLAFKTHPIAAQFGHRFNSIHAEAMAINNFPHPIGFLSECDLISLRIRKTGELGLALPCQYCRAMLKVFSPKNVYYCDDYGEFHDCNDTR